MPTKIKPREALEVNDKLYWDVKNMIKLINEKKMLPSVTDEQAILAMASELDRLYIEHYSKNGGLRFVHEIPCSRGSWAYRDSKNGARGLQGPGPMELVVDSYLIEKYPELVPLAGGEINPYFLKFVNGISEQRKKELSVKVLDEHNKREEWLETSILRGGALHWYFVEYPKLVNLHKDYPKASYCITFHGLAVQKTQAEALANAVPSSAYPNAEADLQNYITSMSASLRSGFIKAEDSLALGITALISRLNQKKDLAKATTGVTVVQTVASQILNDAMESGYTNDPTPPPWMNPVVPLVAGAAIIGMILFIRRRK